MCPCGLDQQTSVEGRLPEGCILTDASTRPPHLAHICFSAGLPFVAADHPLRFSRVSPVRGGVLSHEHKHTQVLKYAHPPPQPGGRVCKQAFHILLIACRATCPRGAGQSPVLPLTGLRLRSTHLCIPRGKEKGPRE